MSKGFTDSTLLEERPTTFGSDVGSEVAERTARWIGRRLRSVRQQKQLSLSDVELLSRGDFGPSSVGAYERGDRTISMTRLDQLADLYDVPIRQFLPRPLEVSVRAARTSPILEPLTVDIVRLRTMDEEPFRTLLRFINLIRHQRGDHHPTIITLRGADALFVSAVLDVTLEGLIAHLDHLGLLGAT